jgi:hypothetical protein
MGTRVLGSLHLNCYRVPLKENIPHGLKIASHAVSFCLCHRRSSNRFTITTYCPRGLDSNRMALISIRRRVPKDSYVLIPCYCVIERSQWEGFSGACISCGAQIKSFARAPTYTLHPTTQLLNSGNSTPVTRLHDCLRFYDCQNGQVYTNTRIPESTQVSRTCLAGPPKLKYSLPSAL